MAFLFYFDSMEFIIVNGNVIEKNNAGLSPDDHSYRYGDGLFETMKIANGNILLEEYHFERLFSGLELLKFKIPLHFSKQKISEEVKKLCKKNNCQELARVRLSVSRGRGGLYDCDNKVSYLIESGPLEQNNNVLNENGLVIDIFPDASKSPDKFSNLKSANYLPYIMAAIWAKENKLNDALILNQHNQVCDSTIANVFWVESGNIFTPPLSAGCVAGVMRKRILDLGQNIKEKNLTENDLLHADEVFLTNAINGMCWVKQFRDKIYENRIAVEIFTQIQTIST